MTILSDIEGFLIRATHHQKMASVSIRDLSLDTAVPSATSEYNSMLENTWLILYRKLWAVRLCGQDQIGLFLKFSIATGNHVN